MYIFRTPAKKIRVEKNSEHMLTLRAYVRWNSLRGEFFLRYTYLSPRAENWKFPLRGEMDILTFLHVLNVFIKNTDEVSDKWYYKW